MKIVRFAAGRKVKYGVLAKKEIRSLSTSPFAQFKGPGSAFKYDGDTYQESEVKLLAPCQPSKIVAIGLNYQSHIDEGPKRGVVATPPPTPTNPILFLKPSTAVIGPNAEILLPYLDGQVEYEGELGVVIGRKAKDVSRKDAKSYILGYTCFNDVSERLAQRSDKQWTRGKGFDTFAPFGPWIETEVNPDNLKLETLLNGEVRQSSSTKSLIFGISELIYFVTHVMTLLPGDVIATGTPEGVGKIDVGDKVEIRIEGIGSLVNTVAYHKK
ncbi:MAG: fumarylacetoacetate hydrolase family protein [Chloroflexota bacterium]